MGLPHIHRRIKNTRIKLLIATGANSNYCRPGVFHDEIILLIKKRAHTVNGDITIEKCHDVLIFDIITKFCVINNLEYDALIGSKLLNQANAKINYETSILSYGTKQEKIYFDALEWIKNLRDIDSLVEHMTNKIKNVHSDINTSLPFRTDVLAEIKTVSDKPV